jgi:demethylmenaquinone methyltransferase/2-methoxy-6-polyprenyl-1,4-benzoquinol methylase
MNASPPQSSRREDAPAPVRGGEDPGSARFEPHAAREMAGMFDDVSARYDLINRLMTLGLDDAWREVMWRQVPESARVVVDLCTGNGVSAEGLRRTGRTVLGLDVSFGMLEQASANCGRGGWAPRFAAADAFRLPLRAESADAVTVAFGMRNLRPRPGALAEIHRVLRPGGTLAVLEAAAPRPGPFAPLHTLHLAYGIPLLGRLSPDPSAYRYLSRSIFEFGDGARFAEELLAAGFEPAGTRAFLLGAARLWVCRRGGEARQTLQNASPDGQKWGDLPNPRDPRTAEWRLWNGMRLGLSLAVLLTLIMSFSSLTELADRAALAPWQRTSARALIVASIVFFALRSLVQLPRFLGPPRRR